MGLTLRTEIRWTGSRKERMWIIESSLSETNFVMIKSYHVQSWLVSPPTMGPDFFPARDIESRDSTRMS